MRKMASDKKKAPENLQASSKDRDPESNQTEPDSPFIKPSELKPETKEISLSRIQKIFAPILVKNYSLSDESGPCSRFGYSLLCPPHGRVGTLITWILAVFLVWGTAVAVLGPIALPGNSPIQFEVSGGTVFSLIALVSSAYVGGWIVSLVKLPPLLGMLVVGIVLKNVPYIDVGRGLDPSWSAALRSTALAVILLRAGLGLDPRALKQLSAMVFRLAFFPCLVEATVVAISSHLLLGFPWLWGFMLGFILAAVSPAVVVPCLLSLQERGFGVEKGIPTLVIAAASVDDVLAISVFTILLGVTFNTNQDNLYQLILQGPLEAIVGVLGGFIWGVLVIFLPPSPHPNVLLRVVLLFGGSLFALFGSAMAGFPGAGALGVLVLAFVAGLGWRRQGWKEDNPVSQTLAQMWIIFQPLLFGLIGTEIQVDKLDPETVGLGIGVLVCGLSARLVLSYISVLGGDVNHRERMFIALAWLPKATVQAAIGPLALDLATQALRKAGMDGENLPELNEQLELAEKVLTLAVLVILITAPIGAVAIMASGPRLLTKMNKPLPYDIKEEGEEMSEMIS